MADWKVTPENYPPSTFIRPTDQLTVMRDFTANCAARKRGRQCQACAYILASIAEIEHLRANFPALQISDGPPTR